jgi:hypothetical protein
MSPGKRDRRVNVTHGPVASTFSGRANSAVIGGFAGAAWAPGGQPKVLFEFIIDNDVVVVIDMTADPHRIADAEITLDRVNARRISWSTRGPRNFAGKTGSISRSRAAIAAFADRRAD